MVGWLVGWLVGLVGPGSSESAQTVVTGLGFAQPFQPGGPPCPCHGDEGVSWFVSPMAHAHEAEEEGHGRRDGVEVPQSGHVEHQRSERHERRGEQNGVDGLVTLDLGLHTTRPVV